MKEQPEKLARINPNETTHGKSKQRPDRQNTEEVMPNYLRSKERKRRPETENA